MELTKKIKRRENSGEEESNHEASSGFTNLPLEVMTEILLRLPTRSIGQFRCVSKPFCSLLSDPKFAKNHLDLILGKDIVRSRNQRLLLSLNNLFSVNFDSIEDKEIKDLTVVELDYPLKEDVESSSRRNLVEIVGSSNGLVCIHPDKGGIFLYNPTIGESKRIPDFPEFKRIPELLESFRTKSVDKNLVKFEIHGFGFGFDAFTDDYKVVKFVSSNDDDLNANVYSLKTNKWRRICDLRYSYIYPKPGVKLNGAIHWIVHLEEEEDGVNQRVVGVFDLKTEEFREMSLPYEAKYCRHRFMKFELGILKGCLCVVYRCYEMHDDIWVMNEYGIESSWSKIQLSSSYISMKPLCSTKNDEEVLLVLDEHLVLYNFEDNTSRNLEISGVDLRLKFEADTYVESLISPNSHGIES